MSPSTNTCPFKNTKRDRRDECSDTNRTSRKLSFPERNDGEAGGRKQTTCLNGLFPWRPRRKCFHEEMVAAAAASLCAPN